MIWSLAVWGAGSWGAANMGLCVVTMLAKNRADIYLSCPNRAEVSLSERAKVEVSAVYSVLKSNIVTIEARFFKNGAYADPTTVTLAMKKPDGTALSPAQTLTRQSLGVWSCDFDTQGQAAGVWSFRAEGEGNCDSAAEGSFEITASAVV